MIHKVLVTDYAWPSLDVERQVLGSADATLIISQTGDETELIKLAPEANAILTCWKPVTKPVLDIATKCVVVSRYGVGLDNIDVTHATKLGMLVTNVPDFCFEEVSDHTMALLLACARNITKFSQSTQGGAWKMNVGPPLQRLRGQTLGLIGYGLSAKALVPKALGFGMKVIAYTPRITSDTLSSLGTATRDLNLLLSVSDYVSIHAPLTDDTRALIDEDELRLMKPTAYLINTARGAIINEKMLYRALTEGWIAGAALDVMSNEPPAPNHPLLELDNVIVTPHAAFYSISAIEELATKAAEHVAQALIGEVPSNVVNPKVMKQSNCRISYG